MSSPFATLLLLSALSGSHTMAPALGVTATPTAVQLGSERDQSCFDASGKPIDVLEQFRVEYFRNQRRDRAMRLLYDGIRQNCIRYDDNRHVKLMLHGVAEYFVDAPDDEAFSSLVLSMLDESRTRLIVDEFGEWADQKGRAPAGGSAVDSQRVARYVALHRLALRAEQRWWEPVAVYVESLSSVGSIGKRLSFEVVARNRAGRNTRLPGSLVVRVEPPNVAELSEDERSVTPLTQGPAEFSVVVGTPDGRLSDAHRVTVMPSPSATPPVAALSPEGGVVEIGELFKLTVTANPTLARERWDFDWEPRALVYGLKTYQDSTKRVLTLSGRKSGVVSLRVAERGVTMSQASLYILPPAASLKIPNAWTTALIGSIAGAIQANNKKDYIARRWWTFGAIPITSVGAATSWINFRRVGNARRHFLEQVPQGVQSTPDSTPERLH